MGIHLAKQSQRPLSPDPSSTPTNSVYERVRDLWRHSSENGSIALHEFLAPSEPEVPIHYDQLVQLLGGGQFDQSPFGAWVFEQAARALSSIPADTCAGHNTEYSHAVKYLFLGACAQPTPHRSLLDASHNFPLAERLVDISVSFCEQSHSLGTALISVRGIIASNIRTWASSRDISTFLFHPRSLASPEFLTLVEDARLQSLQRTPSTRENNTDTPTSDPYAICLHFCAAKSPEEFLGWAVANRVRLPLSECFEAIQAALTKSGNLANLHLGGISTRQGTEHSNNTHCDLTYRPGIYVDVFGTIIQHDGNPNLRLITLVRDLMQQKPYREVFLVSDSEHAELAAALQPVGEPLPPVIRKEELRNHELEVLIDNCEPEAQGLHARMYFQPREAIDAAARLLQPHGVVLGS